MAGEIAGDDAEEFQKVFSVAKLEPGGSSEAIYDEWARAYDRELTDVGYNSPPLVAETLAGMLADRSAPIIDYGCGTGLSGAALAAVGFVEIDGADLSGNYIMAGS